MDNLYIVAAVVTGLLGLAAVYSIFNGNKRKAKALKRLAEEAAGTLSYKTITVDILNKVAVICFAREKKKNAFSKLMYREVERAIRSASENKNITVIMISGLGDYYSSGNDLSNFSELKHPLTIAKEAKEVLFSFIDSFISCQKPIIACVNGPAIG